MLEYLATSSMAMRQPEDAGPATAEVLGYAQAEQPGRPERLEHVVGVLPGTVDLPGPRLDLLLGQAADRLLQRQVLVGELEIHKGGGYRTSRERGTWGPRRVARGRRPGTPAPRPLRFGGTLRSLDETPPPPAEHPEPPAPANRQSIQAELRRAQEPRRRWPRRVLYSLLAVVLVAALAGIAGIAYARYRFDQIKKVHAKHLVAAPAPGKPFNILLVGSDSRNFVVNPTQENAFGNPAQQGGQRSDVTMVARVIPATKQITIMSIPRDTWVDIPGDEPDISGWNRINTAFNSGPDLLIQTIEHTFGIPINHYVSVNFNGFQSMVDALGGVMMDFPAPVKDSYSGLDVTTTGCQLVPGTTALELVRARHLYYELDGVWQYDGQSDFSRIQRQDAFFHAVLDKLSASLGNPLTVNSFIGAAVNNLTIDDTLSESDIFHLATEFHGMTSANLRTETLPTYGFVTDAGADVLGVAQPQANQMIAQFNQLGMPAPSTTTTTTTTTTTVPTLAPGSVKVQVLNGAGIAGIAAATQTKLEAAGFPVTGIGDAANFGYQTSQIEYGPSGKEAAMVLADHLVGDATLVPDASLEGTSVTLIIGQSLGGVTTGIAPTTTTTTTLPDTSSTTTPPSEVYTNTAPEPWNPYPC